MSVWGSVDRDSGTIAIGDCLFLDTTTGKVYTGDFNEEGNTDLQLGLARSSVSKDLIDTNEAVVHINSLPSFSKWDLKEIDRILKMGAGGQFSKKESPYLSGKEAMVEHELRIEAVNKMMKNYDRAGRPRPKKRGRNLSIDEARDYVNSMENMPDHLRGTKNWTSFVEPKPGYEGPTQSASPVKISGFEINYGSATSGRTKGSRTGRQGANPKSPAELGKMQRAYHRKLESLHPATSKRVEEEGEIVDLTVEEWKMLRSVLLAGRNEALPGGATRKVIRTIIEKLFD